MGIQTLNDIFFAIAARDQAPCMLRKSEGGWQPISSRELAQKVNSVAQALRSWGLRMVTALPFSGKTGMNGWSPILPV